MEGRIGDGFSTTIGSMGGNVTAGKGGGAIGSGGDARGDITLLGILVIVLGGGEGEISTCNSRDRGLFRGGVTLLGTECTFPTKPRTMSLSGTPFTFACTILRDLCSGSLAGSRQ